MWRVWRRLQSWSPASCSSPGPAAENISVKSEKIFEKLTWTKQVANMPELPPKRNLIELGMVAVLTSPMLLPPGFGLGSLEERKYFNGSQEMFWKGGNISTFVTQER